MINDNQDQNGIGEPTDSQSGKVRYGAPDGPRQKRGEKYDGRDPLEYVGHEAVAQFLASPKTLREFKSVTALAEYFKVARKTIYCWMQDIDVLRRAEWLSLRNEMAGNLVVRREWGRITKKAVEGALSGDVKAMQFCRVLAWPEDKQSEGSAANESPTLADGIRTLEQMYSPPTWLKRRQAIEDQAEEEAAAKKKDDALAEHEDLPE